MSLATKSFCAVGIVLSLVLCVEVARPCVRGFPNYIVGSSFVVHVVDNKGKPLAGAIVRITKFEKDSKSVRAKEIKTTPTENSGEAAFEELPGGEYFVDCKLGEISGGAGTLTIDSSSRVRRVELSWPMGPIFAIQKPAGTLLAGEGRVPLVNAGMSLIDIRSWKTLQSVSTDDRGRFSFNGTKPGIYAFHVAVGIVNGNILVELNPKAEDTELPEFQLGMTDCGLNGVMNDGKYVLFGG